MRRWDITGKKKMKKFFMMLFAALSISVAANAACGNVVAFTSVTESAQFEACTQAQTIKLDGSIVATYSKNPFHNDSMCSPGKKWCTCFEYCFSYKGTTYYFNL